MNLIALIQFFNNNISDNETVRVTIDLLGGKSANVSIEHTIENNGFSFTRGLPPSITGRMINPWNALSLMNQINALFNNSEEMNKIDGLLQSGTVEVTIDDIPINILPDDQLFSFNIKNNDETCNTVNDFIYIYRNRSLADEEQTSTHSLTTTPIRVVDNRIVQKLSPKAQGHQNSMLVIHSLATGGFAALFATFALATQGFDIGSAALILASAVSAICVMAAYYEYRQYQLDQKGWVHGLNGIAFMTALIGLMSGVVLEYISSQAPHLLHQSPFFPKALTPVPVGFFILATFLLTVSTYLDNRNKANKEKKSLFSIGIQLAGVIFLFIGTFPPLASAHILSTPLPTNGTPLATLNYFISAFALLASLGALYGLYSAQTSGDPKPKLNDLITSGHIMAAAGFAVLFATFSLTTQGYAMGSAGFVLSLAVAAVCMQAMYNEFSYASHYKQDDNRTSHVFSGFAFMFAMLGSIGIALDYSLTSFHQFLPKVLPIPAGLFTIATLLFITSTLKANKPTKEKMTNSVCILAQTVGATILCIGAFQNPGIIETTLLTPQAITICSGVACLGALAMMYITHKGYTATSEEPMHQVDSFDNDGRTGSNEPGLETAESADFHRSVAVAGM